MTKKEKILFIFHSIGFGFITLFRYIKMLLKEKWKDILFIVISMILVISGIALYKYLNDRDIANISNDENNEILYQDAFTDFWQNSYINFGSVRSGQYIHYSISNLVYDFDAKTLYFQNFYSDIIALADSSWDDYGSGFDAYIEFKFNNNSLGTDWNNVYFIVNDTFYRYAEISGTFTYQDNTYTSFTISKNDYGYYINPSAPLLDKQLSDIYITFDTMFASDLLDYEFLYSRFGLGMYQNTSISYSEGYNDGYNVGFSEGVRNSNTNTSQTIQNLQNEINNQNTTINNLTTSYNDLQNSNTILQQNYNILLEQYNALLNQSDYSFSELFWSISAVPFNVIKSGFNVNILGANIGSIITGLFTAAIVIWLFKKLFK